MSDLDSKQLQNAHAFMKHLGPGEWDALSDLIAPTFKQQYFPASAIPPEGKDMRGKEEFLTLLRYNWANVFEKVTVGTSPRTLFFPAIDLDPDLQFGEPLDVIHGHNKVALHVRSSSLTTRINCSPRFVSIQLKSNALSKSGKKYDNEYMVTFHFDGEKILKMNEFVDSIKSNAFVNALKAG